MRGRRAPGVASGHGRSGGEDRPGRAQARQHPLARAQACEELPLYLGGWDVALCRSHATSTRFISPTKTPEYLAAGRPVVSTPITDVVRSYGEAGLARIAATPDEFVVQCEAALRDAESPGWLVRSIARSARCPGILTYARMRELMRCAA